jgi:serine/threonine protein kinase
MVSLESLLIPTPLTIITRMTQVAYAVHFLHKNDIIHRDIKLENILISEKDDAYLADLGLATKVKPGVKSSGLAGTPAYMAPEVWRQDPYGFQVDVWSLGTTMYLLNYPNDFLTNEAMQKAIHAVSEPVGLKTIPFPNNINDPVVLPLLKEMLQYNDTGRISMSSVLAFDYMRPSGKQSWYEDLAAAQPLDILQDYTIQQVLVSDTRIWEFKGKSHETKTDVLIYCRRKPEIPKDSINLRYDAHAEKKRLGYSDPLFLAQSYICPQKKEHVSKCHVASDIKDSEIDCLVGEIPGQSIESLCIEPAEVCK